MSKFYGFPNFIVSCNFKKQLAIKKERKKEEKKMGKNGLISQSKESKDKRGTAALHLNEPTWIIYGSNELIVDFPFAQVIFLDFTQPWLLKSSK